MSPNHGMKSRENLWRSYEVITSNHVSRWEQRAARGIMDFDDPRCTAPAPRYRRLAESGIMICVSYPRQSRAVTKSRYGLPNILGGAARQRIIRHATLRKRDYPVQCSLRS